MATPRKTHKTHTLSRTEARAVAMLRKRPRLLQVLVGARPGDVLLMPQSPRARGGR